ncbi:hypothetical protein LCL90_03660 [Bacillus infantis]|uniref:hypothetical protein n=1 Tax=Bacillus infantis TaxID=324767 RepID=UPI001CD46F8E|nr:hypothetical protein [Bacillus infantis]MCA1033716.1 hypothetical protein [Bacillus infantis]
MIRLEENQHILIKEYQDLLVTVEEALEYIVASFDNLKRLKATVYFWMYSRRCLILQVPVNS